MDVSVEGGRMSLRHLVHAARWAALIGAALFVAGIFPFTAHDAHGVGDVPGTLDVQASPTTNLVDGTVVNVHVSAQDTVVYSLQARVCMPGKVSGDYAFSFVSKFCSNAPIGSGDVQQSVTFAGDKSGDLAFKIGSGTVNWTNGIGFPLTMTCGPGSPCDLVLQVEINNGTAYYQIPLCYGSDCPAPPAPVAANDAAVAETPPPPPPTSAPPATDAPAATPAAAPGAKSGPGSASSAPPPAKPAEAAPTGTSHSSGSNDEQVAAATAATTTSPVSDPTRGARVFVAAAAGALCGARILWVLTRARRSQAMGAA
jgi:hypothetical protein